jgi:hypothetical protein
MRVRVPSKCVVERFHLTYELNCAQKGVDVLIGYYKIQRMKIAVDGRRVPRGYPICESISFSFLFTFWNLKVGCVTSYYLLDATVSEKQQGIKPTFFNA